MKYLLAAFIFCSCNAANNNQTQTISAEVLDTITAPGGSVTAAPFIFENAFVKGTTEKVKDLSVSFYGITIGKLKITTGKIIACDPLHIDEYGIPFMQVFPVGEFPVQLSIMKVADEEGVAFARIHFSDEPVMKWELALQKGQEPLPVGGSKIHGYSVDASKGVFADEAVAKALSEEDQSAMERVLNNEMKAHYHIGWRYTIHDMGTHNMAAFSSGLGDGEYATYIGFDAAGKPCRLVTDFGLFDWAKAN